MNANQDEKKASDFEMLLSDQRILPFKTPKSLSTTATYESVAPGPSKEELRAAIHAVSQNEGNIVYATNHHLVLEVDRERISSKIFNTIIDEIGRLRELTFREEGEGTKLSRDIDAFDEWYSQIVLWDDEVQDIVGGCRIGKSDKIISQQGIEGIYSNQMFQFDPQFFEFLQHPGVDFGRVFIRKEHQKRSVVGQFLLWKGLLRVFSLDPRYRFAFGTCSISDRLSQLSIELLISYCRQCYSLNDSNTFTHPARPYKNKVPLESLDQLLQSFHSLEDLEKCIQLLEGGNPIPPLLTTYLDFGSKTFGSVEDPDFNSFDIGIILDMVEGFSKNKPRLMQRLMGMSNFENYLHYHSGDYRAMAA